MPRLLQRLPGGLVQVEIEPGNEATLPEHIAVAKYGPLDEGFGGQGVGPQPEEMVFEPQPVAQPQPDYAQGLSPEALEPPQSEMVFDPQVVATPGTSRSVSGPINEARAARMQRQSGVKGAMAQAADTSLYDQAFAQGQAAIMGQRDAAQESAARQAAQADAEARQLGELQSGTTLKNFQQESLALQKQRLALGEITPEQFAQDQAAYDSWVSQNPEEAGAEELGALHGRQLRAQVQAMAANDARRMAEYQRAVDSVPDIDPDQVWEDTSILSKIALVFAAYAGGRGGLAGANNPGIAIANQMVQNDIRAQEANQRKAYERANNLRFMVEYGARQDQVGFENQLVEQARRWKSIEQSALALRDQFASQRNRLEAENLAAMANSEAGLRLAQLSQGLAENRTKLAQTKVENIQRQQGLNIQAAQQRESVRHNKETEKGKAEKVKLPRLLTQGVQVRIPTGKKNPDGSPIYANANLVMPEGFSTEEQAQLEKRTGGVQRAVQSFEEARKLAAGTTTAAILKDRAVYNRIEGLVKDGLKASAAARGENARSGSDLDRADALQVLLGKQNVDGLPGFLKELTLGGETDIRQLIESYMTREIAEVTSLLTSQGPNTQIQINDPETGQSVVVPISQIGGLKPGMIYFGPNKDIGAASKAPSETRTREQLFQELRQDAQLSTVPGELRRTHGEVQEAFKGDVARPDLERGGRLASYQKLVQRTLEEGANLNEAKATLEELSLLRSNWDREVGFAQGKKDLLEMETKLRNYINRPEYTGELETGFFKLAPEPQYYTVPRSIREIE